MSNFLVSAVVTPESKEKAELLKVLSDLAGRLEHELNAVSQTLTNPSNLTTSPDKGS